MLPWACTRRDAKEETLDCTQDDTSVRRSEFTISKSNETDPNMFLGRQIDEWKSLLDTVRLAYDMVETPTEVAKDYEYMDQHDDLLRQSTSECDREEALSESTETTQSPTDSDEQCSELQGLSVYELRRIIVEDRDHAKKLEIEAEDARCRVSDLEAEVSSLKQRLATSERRAEDSDRERLALCKSWRKWDEQLVIAKREHQIQTSTQSRKIQDLENTIHAFKTTRKASQSEADAQARKWHDVPGQMAEHVKLRLEGVTRTWEEAGSGQCTAESCRKLHQELKDLLSSLTRANNEMDSVGDPLVQVDGTALQNSTLPIVS